MSVEKAIMNWSKKDMLKDNPKPKKKNASPEQHTEKQCMAWFNFTGFSMSVVESKGVWNNAARRYLKGNTVSGFPDSAGCTPTGYGSFVEFKAKGKISTLKPHQRKFLTDKIIKGCFACVVDEVELLQKNYQMWNLFMLDGEHSQAKAFLLNILPSQKVKVDKDLDL